MADSFFTVLQIIRPEIETAVQIEFARFKKENNARFPLDNWLLDEAARRATLGKLMRGGLVVAMAEALGSTDRRAAIQTAAALEIYGTAILIQDDVMDEADARRGLPTINKIAEKYALEHQLSNSKHFGDSLATCLGDVLFFMADRMIAELEIPEKIKKQLQQVSSFELQRLGLAQIEDARLAASSKLDDTITKEQIIQMISGKTAHYSVCWPLAMACALADTDQATTQKILEIGEQIGILFQLRDDELGLIGDPAVMGKSNLSDLREGKKTLYWLELHSRLSTDDKFWIIFGNSNATDEEIETIRRQVIELGIIESVRQRELMLRSQENQQLLSEAHLPDSVANHLHELLLFVLERQK
jgi:geranylgeranyl pyrophosphate synthase